jgi:hypothetical protein
MKAVIHAGFLAYRAIVADYDLKTVCRFMVRKSHESGHAVLTTLLTELFGNPLRPVTISPAVLDWNAGTVVKLAQAIYDSRRFMDMPVLADALEEAGCTSQSVLNHCRHLGDHVRGCWALDLLLRGNTGVAL